MDQDFRVSETGLRLDRLLAVRLRGYSRAYLQELIARGCVTVGGLRRSPDYRLRAGEAVRLRWPACAWEELPFEDWVLFEDRCLLVLSKPAGLLMHPVGESWLHTPRAASTEKEPNLAGLLFLRRSGILEAGVSRCGLVHRLDRETSGVLLVAKTSSSQRSLERAFADRLVGKVYRAVVLGNPEGRLEVRAPVGRGRGGRGIRVTPLGREAETGVRVLASGRGVSLVSAEPKTGRTHQIRAHLAHVGHPVLGDPEAGRDCASRLAALGHPPPPRMMLHAWRVELRHPEKGKLLRFAVPPPKDFREYWRRVR